MALDIKQVLEDEVQLLALTGYKIEEFKLLCEYFSEVYKEYISHRLVDSKKARERQVRKARKNALLPTDEHRLLFVLYHLKLNPIQSQLGFQFGMDQTQVSKKLSLLEPILETALDAHAKVKGIVIETNPCRISTKIKGKEEVIVDVTERPIQRSADYEQQKEDFSGKKKTLR
jgi:hypothetical protein